MTQSLTTIELQIVTDNFAKGIGLVNQNLLLFECLRYNKLSEECKQGPVGKAIYKRMKSLNENVLRA